MEQSQLLRLPPGQLIHHVEGEVEVVRILEGDGLERPVLPLGHVDEVLPDPLLPLLAGDRPPLQLLLLGGEGDVLGGV